MDEHDRKPWFQPGNCVLTEEYLVLWDFFPNKFYELWPLAQTNGELDIVYVQWDYV